MPEEVDYVGQEALGIATEWEKRLQGVSPRAGILFVSVRPLPAPKGACNTFNIFLGITKQFEPATAVALVQHLFEKEIQEARFNIRATAVRGVLGAASDSSDEDPRPLAS